MTIHRVAPKSTTGVSKQVRMEDFRRSLPKAPRERMLSLIGKLLVSSIVDNLRPSADMYKNHFGEEGLSFAITLDQIPRPSEIAREIKILLKSHADPKIVETSLDRAFVLMKGDSHQRWTALTVLRLTPIPEEHPKLSQIGAFLENTIGTDKSLFNKVAASVTALSMRGILPGRSKTAIKLLAKSLKTDFDKALTVRSKYIRSDRDGTRTFYPSYEAMMFDEYLESLRTILLPILKKIIDTF